MKRNSTSIGNNISIFFLSSPIQLTISTNISRIISQHASPPDLMDQLAQVTMCTHRQTTCTVQNDHISLSLCQ
jgi:hypothetical protein